MGNCGLRRNGTVRHVKVAPVPRLEGDGQESQAATSADSSGAHVTLKVPAVDTLQSSGENESRKRKPPLDLQLSNTVDGPVGRRSRSNTTGSVEMGDPMDYKSQPMSPSAESTSVGRGSRSGTQNSMSPVTKTPMSPGGSRSRSNTVDSTRGLESVICADASAKAVTKLKDILSKLDKGEAPDRTSLKSTLRYAASILSTISEQNSPVDGPSDASLQLVDDAEVRAWLTSTFTRRDSCFERPNQGNKRTFKAVADAVMIGQYFGKMADSYQVTYPVAVAEFFEEQVHGWNCDMFQLEALTDVQPLRYTGYHLFKHHQLLEEYKISKSSLDAFLCRVEEAYQTHSNPYHNSTHAADVLQTVHCLVVTTNLSEWLSRLELLALLFAAVIHDIEHTGTTNSYHVQAYSDLALCYNDKSILENHHLNKAFSLLREDDLNIFRGLNLEQFRLVRSLVIEMVLATDMTKHFKHLKYMKRLLACPDALAQLEGTERPKLLCQLLHMADISHPGKDWRLHQQWTSRLMDEFFKQGDMQRENGYQYSPLCDRNTTPIPQSQIGFIEVIVGPSLEVFNETLELVLSSRQKNGNSNGEVKVKPNLRFWANHLSENKKRWIDLKDRDSTTTSPKHCNGEVTTTTSPKHSNGEVVQNEREQSSSNTELK